MKHLDESSLFLKKRTNLHHYQNFQHYLMLIFLMQLLQHHHQYHLQHKHILLSLDLNLLLLLHKVFLPTLHYSTHQ